MTESPTGPPGGVPSGGVNQALWAVLVAAVLGGLWWGAPRPATEQASALAPVETMADAPIMVHVSGWVARPGVVVLDDPARVADAITAAGGVRPGANLTQINLAAPVADGEMVIVPGPDQTGEPAAGASDGLVDINRADATTLESLPGVGPVLAGRIVAYREQHGRFETIEDLLNVSGVGEKKLESLRPFLRSP